MGTSIAPTVDGRWLALDTLYGDVQLSTVWPGGSDQLSWVPVSPLLGRYSGGEPTVGYFGPVPVFRGSLTEPDPSQGRMVARGSWRDGDDYVALDGSGNATTVPDTAVDQAISRGLSWTRPTSVSTTAVDLDVSQGPVTLGALLDSWTEQSGQKWGVNARNQLVTKADDTTPLYKTFPLDGGLGYALDTYASTLVGRYQTSTGYATATRTDSVAEGLHGHVEAVVDLTPRGILTSTKANNILDNLLALGRAVPQWVTGIQLGPGELLNLAGTPVALETVSAGCLLRIWGGLDVVTRLGQQLYIDIPIGMTQLSGGLLQMQPAELATRNLTDVFTAALTKKK